jgi:hypothetical protein
LCFINGKPKRAVEHLVSVIKPATIKALIESKLEMDKSDLKKDILEFVAYLEKMAIIHNEYCHVVECKKTGDSGVKNTGKSSDSGSRSYGPSSGKSSYGGGSNKVSVRDRTKSGHERSSDSTGKQSVREPPPCLISKSCAGEKYYLSDCLHTRRDEAIAVLSEYKNKRYAEKKNENFNWGTTERRLTA